MSKPRDPRARHQSAVTREGVRCPRIPLPPPPAPHQRPAHRVQGVTAEEHARLLARRRFRQELAAGVLGTTQIAAGMVVALTTRDQELLADISAAVGGTDREQAVVDAVNAALREMSRTATGLQAAESIPVIAEQAAAVAEQAHDAGEGGHD